MYEHAANLTGTCVLVTGAASGIGAAVTESLTSAGPPAESPEIAAALLFLADSRMASYINGVNLDVDGGTGAAHALGVW